MNKRWMIPVAVLVIAATVAAVILLRQPPLITANDVAAVAVDINGRGHKETTDLKLCQEVLKQINDLRREEMPDVDDRKGAYAVISVSFEDGSKQQLWLLQTTEAYTVDGVTFPAGEYLRLYPEGYYRVEAGACNALTALFDGWSSPYANGSVSE